MRGAAFRVTFRAMGGASITTELRAEALRIWQAGVAAADPRRAVTDALADPALRARLRPGPGGALVIVAVGKAARAMAAAAQRVLDPARVIVVTNAGNDAALPGAEVLTAGHPVPDAGGAAAAERVIALAQGLGAGDRLLALISGGGSAMLPAPAEGLGLADKAAVNRLLLASGADIVTTNLVRQQVSRLKGGGLLRMAAPAPVTALILSDVIGDDLRAIASGPTVAPIGSRADARAVLHQLGLWDRLPAPVRRHLDAPLPPADAADLPAPENRLVGSNAISLAAMAAAGAVPVDPPLTGDVACAAARVIAAAQAVPPGRALAFGGETTVRVTGAGLGGRNQELALRVAMLAEAAGLAGPWVFLAGGSDGRDGPTNAAGGVVDGGSLARMRAAGVDPAALLAANDSHAALAAAADLVLTGATGTNVADLAVFLRR